MELQERHAGPRAYGPPSPFQGNAERNSARGGGRGGGRVGRRGGAWVPAGPPALLSPPGVLCSLLRPGEVTAWPPQFYAQGFRKLQMDKQPSPFPHPSPSPRRPLPPHTHILSLSLVRIPLSPFLQGHTQFVCLPLSLAGLSFLSTPPLPWVSFYSSAYFSCALTFSGSDSFRLSLNFLLPLPPFPIFSLHVCLSVPLPLLPWFWASSLLSSPSTSQR